MVGSEVRQHTIVSNTNGIGDSFLHLSQPNSGFKNTFRLANPKQTGNFFVDSKGTVWACNYVDRAIHASYTIDIKGENGETESLCLSVLGKHEPIPDDIDVFDSARRVVSGEIYSCQPDVQCQVLSYRYTQKDETVVRVRLTGIDDVHTFTLSANNDVL